MNAVILALAMRSAEGSQMGGIEASIAGWFPVTRQRADGISSKNRSLEELEEENKVKRGYVSV